MHALDRPEPDDDDFWDDLLQGIEEGRVVPIIGAELLRYPGQDSFDRQAAQALAARLRLPMAELPPAYGLEDVVGRHLRLRGRREELYAKLRTVVRELGLPPPQPLLDLASIGNLDLFVSLTYDALMVEAIDRIRFGGAAHTLHLAFAPNRLPQDLPAPRGQLDTPVVYSLLGKLSSMPEYAISEEDTLEFLTALQSEARRPQLLFDELQHNHLLLLGCSFPDWLARFFIRIAKSRQLSAQRAEVETIVEDRIAGDPALTVFLEHYSYGTRVRPGDPVAFVAELARRWHLRRPARLPPAGQRVDGSEPDSGGVFVSYASEDLAAARRLSEWLQTLGLDVWFDKQGLQAGDAYDPMIRRRIKACALFLPVVSAQTSRRLEGWFRREWRLAEERVEGIADELPFILPVAIDASAADSPGVPASFARAQWARLPDGAADEAFGARLVALVRAFRKRQAGLG